MTVKEARAFCEQHNDEEFLKFERIEQPRHCRADIAGFILLHALVPTTKDIIVCAEHDIIYCSPHVQLLCERASEADLLELIRCGFILDEEGISRFV